MTDKEIKKYIDLLNSKKSQESIFTRRISETVAVSKVWKEQPKDSDAILANFSSYKFFFIKNTFGIYVGAVLDMYSDLHWYIVPKERKNGHLTKALQEAILPYIFYAERKVQRVTINEEIGNLNYINSKKVALKIGFIPTNKAETEFELKESTFNWDAQSLKEEVNIIGKERIDILRKRVNYAFKLLMKVSEELQMAYDDDCELSVTSLEVKNYTWKIQDLMLEYEKSE